MNPLKNLIKRCHERHNKPLQQRQTLITPATYIPGSSYDYTVYCANKYPLRLYALEEAQISFMPIGRAPENDRGPKTFDRDNRLSKQQLRKHWDMSRWRASWGIQVYTGTPSQRHAAQLHDIRFTYESVCTAPDAVLTCIKTLVDSVVNPLITITKSGGIRFTCRTPNYLHPNKQTDRLYIYSDTEYDKTVYLEILGERGYSPWDARYEIVTGDLLEPPIISKDILFVPIDTLRNQIHKPKSIPHEQSHITHNINDISDIVIPPLSLGTHRLDLAREALIKRDYYYLKQNNNFHQMTPSNNKDPNKHISLWERDGIVWIRASTTDFGLPIEATPITDVFDDTGILNLQSAKTQPIPSNYMQVRQQQISPLSIKRNTPILHKKTNNLPLFNKETEQTFLDGDARILVIQTETGPQKFTEIDALIQHGNSICVNVRTPKIAKELEQHFENNSQSYARLKPRKFQWEKAKNIPIDQRMADPFKHGNICEDAERCNALEENGGNPDKSICPHCPVYTQCQQHGFLSQHTSLQNAQAQITTIDGQFFNPQPLNSASRIIDQIDNSQRISVLYEPNIRSISQKYVLSMEMLKQWIVNWQGQPLGNFANFLGNAFELKGRFYQDTLRRIRTTIQAFLWQEEEIIKQMCQVNIPCKVTEQNYIDPDTDEELAQFTIEFQNGATAYVPLNNTAKDILKEKEIPFFQIPDFVPNTVDATEMKIPMSMEQAIDLGIFNIDTVESINNLQTVCQNPQWTLWHQLKHLFTLYTRDEDVQVLWENDTLSFWILPTLHSNVERLIITTTTFNEAYCRKIFHDENIEFTYSKPVPWKPGNTVYQIRSGVYPRETLMDDTGNWDTLGLTHTGCRLLSGILSEIQKKTNVTHTVISYVAAIKQLSELLNRDNVHFLPNKPDIFKANNDIEQDVASIIQQSQVIWIIGCPEPLQGQIWRQSQILFGHENTCIRYQKDSHTGLYKDHRLQSIYEQKIAKTLKTTFNCAKLDEVDDKTIVLISGLYIPTITDRPETTLFDWEDFEIAGGLDKLPEIIATREHYENEREQFDDQTTREKVEHVLGCSSRQANRILTKLRDDTPLRVPFRNQILSLLADGNKKTVEVVNAINGNPEAVKNELTRLIDRGEIIRVKRGIYSLPQSS